MDTNQLLTREAFKALVFQRDNDACVLCQADAVDAHHLLERKLWKHGGYLLSNGVSLCEGCHLESEYTIYSVEKLRAAAGIETVVLPEWLDASVPVDESPTGFRPGFLFLFPEGAYPWGQTQAFYSFGLRPGFPRSYTTYSLYYVLFTNAVFIIFSDYDYHPRPGSAPSGIQTGCSTDKWGNCITENGWRLPGSLLHEAGCRRALIRGQVLWLFDTPAQETSSASPESGKLHS